MKKICQKCTQNFEITNSDLEFYKKVSPKFDGKIYEIPTPKLCPDCRQQRRLAFRNERNLYKRDCDATGKQIISIYSPDKKYKVYDSKIWWGDSWDALDYGIDFDFERGFFEQFKKLMKEVPNLSLYQLNCERSDYTNACTNSKDCYMSFNTDFSENILYSYTARNCINSIDTGYCDKCENSYELLECGKCFDVFYSFKSSRCLKSYFLFACKNCDYCFMSSNLESKKYYIFNIKYSQENYFKEIERLLKKGFIELQKDFLELIKNTIKREKTGYSNEKSIGDNIFYTKECFNTYDSNNLENCKNCNYLIESKDCMDYQIFGDNSSLIYECLAVGNNCSKIKFCMNCFTSSDLLYCYGSGNCKNCFGCVNLKNAEYCVLNKQYTKEAYNRLVPKIIEKMKETGEWGEFFPASISPFGYNETVAQEYFPLKKEEIIKHNFNYSDFKSPQPNVSKIIPASKLPENISEIPDDILNWAIKCEVSGKPFRIIKQELEFYRKHNLPIPKKHPDIRHLERMKLRNPRKLFDRKCDKCEKNIKSTYDENREEIVYCESCYEKEVY